MAVGRRPEWYYDQINQQLPQYFNPWIDAGKGALPNLQEQFGKLMNDPGGMYDWLGKGYHESPGFKFRRDQAVQGSNQAAAAGGMAGSPMSQQWGAEIAEQMANKDYQDYMDRVTGMYNRGLSGEEGINKTGFDASRGLGEDLASSWGHQAQLSQWRIMMEQMKKMQEEQQGSNFWGGLMGGLGTAGGAIFGGMPGAAIGGAVGSKVGSMF